MEVTALCISLWLNVLFLLCELDQKVDSVSLRVEPDKLQFFLYDPVTLHCEGLDSSTGWKVHHLKGELTNSVTLTTTSTGLSCTIKNVYPDDGGEYWCEAAGGRKRSNSINITVTDGSVILESPVHPVEGDAVNLRCRNKTSSNLTAHFYKDGHLINKSSTGNMTINSVSKSDEGFYKCSISGAGESPESRLTVRVNSGDEVNPNVPPSPSTTPWTIVIFVLLVLLLVVALLHLGKGHWHRVSQYLSRPRTGSGSAEDQTAASAATAHNATYAAVRKNKKKDKDESCAALYYTLGLDEPQEPGKPTASINNALYATVTKPITPPTEDCFYSTIQTVGV